MKNMGILFLFILAGCGKQDILQGCSKQAHFSTYVNREYLGLPKAAYDDISADFIVCLDNKK